MTQVRSTLSHWGPWMTAAYFGIVSVIVALFVINSNTIKRDAAKSAAVSRCLSNRPALAKFQKHILGVNEFATVLVTNSGHVLDETPKTDPQYNVRRANLVRLIKAREQIAALPTFHVPTAAECKNATP